MSKLIDNAKGRIKYSSDEFVENTSKKIEDLKLRAKHKMQDFKNLYIGGGKKLLKVLSLIPIGLVILNISFYLIAIGQTVGSSPHFYCDSKASDDVKSTVQYQQYCKGFGGSSGGNSSIAEAAVSLATTDETVGGRKIDWRSNGFGDVEAYKGNPQYTVDTFLAKVPEIVQVAQDLRTEGKRTTNTWSLPYYASCDLSVSLPVLWSGADDNFPMTLTGAEMYGTGTSGITGHLVNGGSKLWQQVPKGDKILPGDIALGNNHGGYQHVWMYVATWENGTWTDNSIVQKKYPNSTANTYQGSHLDYYASLSNIGDPWKLADVVYRYVGQIDEQSPFLKVK